MRTAIIPSTHNPYILYAWVKNFQSKWYNSVDKVYLYLEGDMWNHLYRYREPFTSNFEKIKEACLDICKDPKINIITESTPEIRSFPQQYKTVGDSRGKAFVKLLSCCEGDCVFTTHDDFFFLNDYYIEEWFSEIESNKMDYVYFVGTDNIQLYSAMSRLYDTSFLKTNVPDWIKDENFYPFGMTSYGFTSKLNLLIESEGDFSDKHYKKEECITELNYIAEKDYDIDYFHLTPLKWHNRGYRKVKSPGDGVYADFSDRKRAPYAYLEMEDFCQYNYPYFHVCLGSFFFTRLILEPEITKQELLKTYTSNASSAKIIERFLYFNVGYVNIFPEELIEKYKIREFHETIKKNISLVERIASEHYKDLNWKFNTFEYFGKTPLLRYI